MSLQDDSKVLFFAIHNTVEWWRHIGRKMGLGEVTVVTDLRGEGDISVVDDFYAHLQRYRRRPDPQFSLLTTDQKAEVIARCRTLRWLDTDLSQAMIESMAEALDRVLEITQPRVIVSFPIDRYVKHVLKLLATARGVPYLELTASVLPAMSMLLDGGRLLKSGLPVDDDVVDRYRAELTAPDFTPSYVSGRSRYTRARFARTLGYFHARALAFKAISWWQRDPLNLHFLDAQPMLGHKCRWRDIRIVGLCDPDWRKKVERFPRNRRVFFALQLFPEASIDYWIDNVDLIDHENLVVRAARAFGEAGFAVAVKDHPLQFGFRQVELIDRLQGLPNAVFVPFDVPANELLSMCGTSFTFTGTVGLQAALKGIESAVTDSYYSNDEDFAVFRTPDELEQLPKRFVGMDSSRVPLVDRQRRIVKHLLQGSFVGDFFSFKGFKHSAKTPGADQMGSALGARLHELSEQGLV